MIFQDFLKHIGTEEFLQMLTPDCDSNKKRNLDASVRWFNRLSHLVATLIITVSTIRVWSIHLHNIDKLKLTNHISFEFEEIIYF